MSISTNDSPKEVLDEVMEEYEKTLVVPNHKSSPQWMLMPVGLVGSGKTTIVKPLAEHFGLIRISTDEVREQLKRRGYSYEGAREITHELQKKYLSLATVLRLTPIQEVPTDSSSIKRLKKHSHRCASYSFTLIRPKSSSSISSEL